MDKEAIKGAFIPILKRKSVVRASLFGSVVRGEDNKDSDMDLLIDFEKARAFLSLSVLR